MHTTSTIDFEYIVSGEVWLELDDGAAVHLRPGDTVVQNGHTTAAECCTLSPFSFEVTDAPSGSYTLVVHDEDASGGEGSGPVQDTKQVTVR